ncbi:aldo/keto reductase [Cryptosporangium arvum]|uniref:Putative oxidoreductase, aryl-alcohol dehydrogenase like protein n=1 Tax=Cryptosporangium arvum DSM 44712 TaxID=927661 RepID=A0A010ZXE7_9ACTN|nr:aldo/keto reductase [Cryptosporangium arvum]EXG81902.1 putative oxidoreductase, aryl-alcohol dehydrogenase like protein [Cryptosporangium arvum DSM 44712]
MEYRYLGRSGTTVSELCLGAMTFGREADEADSRRMLDLFADAGGNFIDTADVYGGGASEEVTGRWLKDRDREQWVIATKVRFPSGPGVNDVGLGRKHILASIDASLRRLGTDYVDLYQIHGWDRATPLEETLSTLDSLVTAGKVRYIGASNVVGWQLQKMLDVSRAAGYERFLTLQPQYSLLARPTEWELIPVCEAEGLGVLPWSPLRGGWLSGRYTREMAGAPDGSRVKTAEAQGWSETWAAYANETTWSILDELRAIADARGRSVAQVALRWVLQRPGVTAPILGASKFSQLEDNLGAVGWELSGEELERLTAVSEVTAPYPYDASMRDLATNR